MSTATTPFVPRHVSRGRLWFGFAGAPVAWALHGFLSVVLTSSACLGNIYQWIWLSQTGLRILLAVLTLCLLALAMMAGFVSYQSWRGLQQEDSPNWPSMEAAKYGREKFMSLGGVLTSSVFVVGIIWGGLPLILLDICRSGE